MKTLRLLFLSLLFCAALRAASSRPNVVLILADDMGFSDIGCYGGEVETPNIDGLAARGLRFTQFYNTARCCPTRASLLTGLYPHQAGVPHMVDNARLPMEQRQLSRHAVTIAEVLGQNGYHTGMSGKWHVCPVDNFKTNGPMSRGFEHFFGIIHGAASYYTPVTLMRDNDSVTNLPPDFYLTDAIAENAAGQIREFARDTKPFFIYAAFTAPHWPLHVPEKDTEKYLARYRRGWDVLREERRQRQIEMGIIDKDTPLSPRDAGSHAWVEDKNQEWQAHRMAVYAAQIERMDRGVGQIVDALKESKALENTLIFFLSDNGGCAEVLGATNKAIHVPLHAPDGGPMRLGNSPQIIPGPPDTYASYGLPWANLSNTPFRTFKHWVHEGGISTPLIVHWPALITKPGLRRDPGHLIDIMATIVEVTKSSYPQEFAGQKIQPMEGISLSASFAGDPTEVRPIFFEHEGNRAIRQGDFKAVSRYPDDWELYNLKQDRAEQTNVAAQFPILFKQLIRQYDQWAERVHVPSPDLVATKPAPKRN